MGQQDAIDAPRGGAAQDVDGNVRVGEGFDDAVDPLAPNGAVGRCVAAIAKGFGMNVKAFDPFIAKEKIAAEGVTPVATFEELYTTCDFVSLHIPKTKETVGSINFELLSKMKKGAAHALMAAASCFSRRNA